MAERDSSPEPEIVQLEIKPGPAANMRVALVILAAAAIAATLGYLLTGAGTKLFSAHTTLTTLVPDTAGIRTGSEVRLSGIPIGNVTGVAISRQVDPQHAIRIDMKVDERFLGHIPSDSQAIVTEDNLLGDQFVSIDEGKSATPISGNGTLASAPVKQAADRADLLKAFQDELRQADQLITQMSSPDTAFGAFVLSSKEYDQVMMRIASFDQAMHAMVGPESQLGPVLFSDKLYTDVRGYVAKVDKTLESIQQGEGMAGRLFTSDKQYNDLLKQLQDLRKSLADVNAGKGMLGGMLHDDAAYLRIRDMLAQTDAMLVALNAGEGSAGRLLRDQQLYESIAGMLRNMQALMADLKANPQKYLRYKVR